MTTPPDDLLERKRQLRAEAQARRRMQADRQALSRRIMERFAAQAECAAARTVAAYVGVGDEVLTTDLLSEMLAAGKRVVVPYCAGDELALFRLERLDELAPAPFGLLEPSKSLRALPAKHVAPEELDLVMVPGVAFDRAGGRLGHGKGYYDRLLARLRPGVLRVGVAFECQLFATVPMLPHDIRLDRLITEADICESGKPKAESG